MHDPADPVEAVPATLVGADEPPRCLACHLRVRAIGVVCAPCSQAIATCAGLLPQQIIAATAGDSRDCLIDQWGRAHALATCTPIGRSGISNGITLLDASVSRSHARIARSEGAWMVCDLGSANGTRVNGEQVTSRVLAHGDRIHFGGVGFYVVFDIGRVMRLPDPAVATSVGPVTTAPMATRAETQPVEGAAEGGALRIVEPTGGGGGLIELAEASAQLSATQLELIDLLSRKMRDDAHLPASVRGYVRSSELVGALSWDTREPNDTHVKQLVRRIRRTLVRAGLGDLIESRHRFGYRLRPGPANDAAEQPAADSAPVASRA